MAFTHDQVVSRLERIQLQRDLRRYRSKLQDRAMFWRLALLGLFMFWAAVAYGIYTLT
jgi:hypothetical protein